jgi:hypothetical protein
MGGFVYIMTNASMPGVVKIGRTKLPPEERARQLQLPCDDRHYVRFEVAALVEADADRLDFGISSRRRSASLGHLRMPQSVRAASRASTPTPQSARDETLVSSRSSGVRRTLDRNFVSNFVTRRRNFIANFIARFFPLAISPIA